MDYNYNNNRFEYYRRRGSINRAKRTCFCADQPSKAKQTEKR